MRLAPIKMKEVKKAIWAQAVWPSGSGKYEASRATDELRRTLAITEANAYGKDFPSEDPTGVPRA